MNSSTLSARLAVDALLRAGVTDVVLCPGSRSAPLAYEVQRRAAEGAVRLHVRHDERVAGFTALGVGAAGGLAAVVTTSGTAVANLHPAVLEAHSAGVPLVVVTADRPPSLRGTWANQTSELQAGLFGAAVRALLDLPDTEVAADPAAARRALAQALAATRGIAGAAGPAARPGPVQLDLGLTEPLLPDDDPPDGVLRDGVPRDGVLPDGARQDEPGPLVLPRGPRTVVVAGDRSGPAARALAETAGWPLLAEPSSGARGGPLAIGPYRLLLELPGLGGAVERVVAFGRPTLSRPVARLLARPDVEVVLVSPYPGWPDPGRPVRRAVAVEVEPSTTGSVGSVGSVGAGGSAGAVDAGDPDGPDDPEARSADAAWSRRWTVADRGARVALDRVLGATPTGPLVAREVSAALRPGETLVAAASNAVRDLDLAARPATGPTPLVVANRGLSGIDGTLSTAVGVALATRRPVRALVGDLAFLHDLNALVAAPGEERPQVQVVVLDDDGGGIFSLLEHGQRATTGPGPARAFERVFGTPHGLDLVALAGATGVPARRAETLDDLRAALAEPLPGTSVVVVRAERAGLRELHARVRAAVHAAAEEAVREAAGV